MMFALSACSGSTPNDSAASTSGQEKILGGKYMPFISTKTNVTVSKEKETQLKERFGQAISIIPGKSKNWQDLLLKDKQAFGERGSMMQRDKKQFS